ncbi:unnamed protein product [Euphydryas editha]|uniref:Uncharacterized protein n=1 Tax=Euphydryas editha TaxID=104508 RepID=A0AAU9VAA0_EUPED|nr:unnamed protein product [Euphydryas editha]
MSKKNTWSNLRDTEIEKALKEIHASSEDDSDDDGRHENYPIPHINEALDNLQGLTRFELLDILEKERVCSPPVSDPHPPSFSPNEDEEMANHEPVTCTIMQDPVCETEQFASHSVLQVTTISIAYHTNTASKVILLGFTF